MISMPARILLAAPLLAALPALAQPLPPLGERPWAQPPAAAPIAPPSWARLSPPLTATVRGVSMQIVEAAWCRAEQLGLENNPFRSPSSVGLALHIEIRSPLPEGKQAADFLLGVTLAGGAGTLDSALESNANLAPAANGVVAFFTGANPRWKSAQLSGQWRDPSATQEAEGIFEREVIFDAPLPAQPDVPLEAKRVWTSAHGGTYTLCSITVRSQPFERTQPGASTLAMPAGVYLTMERKKAERPPGSDAIIEASEGQPTLSTLDSEGNATPLKSQNHSAGWLAIDMTDGKDTLGMNPGILTHYIDRLPPPGARALRIRFQAREESPAWRDPRALSPFRFALDLERLPRPAIDAAWKPVSQARGKYLQVALDEWSELEYHDKARRRLRAVLWTRDIERPNDAQRQWLLRGDTLSVRNGTNNKPAMSLRAGQLFEASSERTFGWPWNGAGFWRPSQAPLGGSELRRPFVFTTSIEAGETAAKAPFEAGMSIEGTWDEWLASEHSWTLADLPVPKPGQVLEPNRVLEHDGARVVLRKLAVFDKAHRFPGVDDDIPDGRPNTSGLVAVFEVLGHAFPGSELSPLDGEGLNFENMSDDRGREVGSFMTGRGDDTSRKSPQGTDARGKPQPGGREQWTTYFRLPAPDAKKLSLRLLLTESKKTGRSETLTLDKLPAPAPIAPQPR